MNYLKTMAFAGFVAASQASHGQTPHLKLSNEHPATGQKISLIYNPTGTALTGKSVIKAALFYNKGNMQASCENIELKQTGAEWKGDFTVPVQASAFYIKPYVSPDDADAMTNHMEQEADNNGGKGYVYMVYEGGHPVKGAYAALENIYAGDGSMWGKIKPDPQLALESLQKELSLNPEFKTQYNDSYYYLYVSSYKEKNRHAVLQVIDSLATIKNEADNNMALNLYRLVGDTSKVRELQTYVKAAYPAGNMVRVDALTAIRTEKDEDKKLKLFAAYQQQFAQPYPTSKADRYLYEFMLPGIITHYLKAKDYIKADQLLSTIESEQSREAAYRHAADIVLKTGTDGRERARKYLDESDEIIRMLTGNAEKYNFYTLTSDEFRQYVGSDLDYNNDLRAAILLQENKTAEALQLQQLVYAHLGTKSPDVVKRYAQLLFVNNQPDRAMDVIAALIKKGRADDEAQVRLKQYYIAAHKSEEGYKAYLGSVNDYAKTVTAERIGKSMINLPAARFVLKDLKGKTVSLAGLKGKVVVVDFWATWCGPCKASFPAMQMAVNKYKNNPDVKFVFIDTWERGKPAGYLSAVKKFITDNKYTFQVLVDEADTEGRQAKVVSQYNVEGIPTKFIIGKEGNIRFKVTGFSGTNQKLVDEISTMIDMAAKPFVAANPKMAINTM